jgi:cell division transport system permease protein
MKENKEVKISYWAAHATTIVSVTLVLMIIGIIALISVSAASESRRLKQQIELSAVMTDSVSDAQATVVLNKIKKEPWVLKANLITKEAALRNWKAETGEDLETLYGVNPLSPEISFTVKAEYASTENLNGISDKIRMLPEVEDVAVPDSAIVESMNRNIESLTMILGAIAIVMLIISFVLINNTVHLAIYSRRFTIHTMQLVGATNSFIRRPFIFNNMLSGLISAMLASCLLGGLLAGASQAGLGELSTYIEPMVFWMVAAGLLVIGVLICAVAALLATSKYLHKDYDALFR